MKIGRILGIVCLILLLGCGMAFFFTPTFSKYVHRVTAPFGEEQHVSYTVNNAFVVKSQDELFAAINQGYTYVQLSKDIENPLIITQGAENLDSDLILDLNGIEIQRNGYEPILNVNKNVRLTIVDTSDEQTGGLYNPVGSVFNINGGILTVVTGTFESGPRYSEYLSYNENVLNSDAGSTTKRTVVEEEAQTVTMYRKSGLAFISSTMTAPIIKSYPTVTGDIVYNHGNLYFDQAITKGDWTIDADTYCYYRTSEDDTFVNTVAMADWYYTYWVHPDGFEYYKAELDSTDTPADFIQITIYGYENTIAGAAAKTNPADYYAAIQMESGTLEVQQGKFYSYFGVDTTACINANGGKIEIGHGTFSSRIPDASSYTAGAVLNKENDANAFLSKYFANYTWFAQAFDPDNPGATPGMLARQGQSYCILNSGNATVSVAEGQFYSSNNNIIKMSDGQLSVSSGTFTKKTTISLSANTNSDAAIFMSNGQLSVANTEYQIFGDYNRAIHMQNGKLEVQNSLYTVSGNHTHGIYSTVSGTGHFVVFNTSFSMINGRNQTGIYTENGEVSVGTNAGSVISADGFDAKGVFANGGSLNSYNYSYQLQGNNSTGIYTEGGNVTVNGGSITLTSNNYCYGVCSASATESFVSVNGTTIRVGNEDISQKEGTHSACVGVYVASTEAGNRIVLNNTDIFSCEVGVALAGGKLNVQGSGTITTKKASAIVVSNGNVSFDTGSSYTITSANTTASATTNAYNLTFPVLTDGVLSQVPFPNTDGIYVHGGSLVSDGDLTLTHTGLQNIVEYDDYSKKTITSYAIRVNGGNVTVTKGNIAANAGGGICCMNGNIIMGNSNSQQSDITVRTLGQAATDSFVPAVPGEASDNWKLPHSIDGGHAIELLGGNITVFNGTYEAAFGNGVSTKSGGTIDIYNGRFYGGMPQTLIGKSGPGAYYGLYMVGGSVVNIYDGVFDGGNGGAFVTGIDDYKNLSGETANVFVYRGVFGNTESADGFNVYDMANVVFGAHNGTLSDSPDTAAEYRDAIQINGKLTSLAINNITNTANYVKPTVSIYYGTYDNNDNTIYSVFRTDADPNPWPIALTVYNYNKGYVGIAYDEALAIFKSSTDVIYYPDTSR